MGLLDFVRSGLPLGFSGSGATDGAASSADSPMSDALCGLIFGRLGVHPELALRETGVGELCGGDVLGAILVGLNPPDRGRGLELCVVDVLVGGNCSVVLVVGDAPLVIAVLIVYRNTFHRGISKDLDFCMPTFETCSE